MILAQNNMIDGLDQGTLPPLNLSILAFHSSFGHDCLQHPILLGQFVPHKKIKSKVAQSKPCFMGTAYIEDAIFFFSLNGGKKTTIYFERSLATSLAYIHEYELGMI